MNTFLALLKGWEMKSNTAAFEAPMAVDFKYSLACADITKVAIWATLKPWYPQFHM